MDDYARVIEAFERLWVAGCPLPVPEQQKRMAEIAFRHWRSFGRRSRTRQPSRADRVRDLTDSLVDALESDPRLIGPLMRDYECVAEAFAAVVEPVNGEAIPPVSRCLTDPA